LEPSSAAPQLRTARDLVELFRLQFLRQLAAGRDKGAYVVKGGCNLRFFFRSLRYAEGLDVDTAGPSVGALRERVDHILASALLRESLQSLRVELTRVSAPKQTETTQRWKIHLSPEALDLPLYTKIEFTRRTTEEEGTLGAVDARLVRRYRLMPLLLCHYPLPAAIRQKVGALVHRREVQARDVFDLSVLLSRAGDESSSLGLTQDLVTRAVELDYDDYMGQVVAYLEPERAEEFASPLVLPEFLTAPAASYVSLQTALHLHGMVEQIPSVVYAVTLARTQRVKTSIATISLHRIAPAFFGGFEVVPRSGAKIATPKKALLDVFYLSAGRSRLFSSLPELELPPGFHSDEARAWIGRIPSSRVRTIVSRRLDRALTDRVR